MNNFEGRFKSLKDLQNAQENANTKSKLNREKIEQRLKGLVDLAFSGDDSKDKKNNLKERFSSFSSHTSTTATSLESEKHEGTVTAKLTEGKNFSLDVVHRKWHEELDDDVNYIAGRVSEVYDQPVQEKHNVLDTWVILWINLYVMREHLIEENKKNLAADEINEKQKKIKKIDDILNSMVKVYQQVANVMSLLNSAPPELIAQMNVMSGLQKDILISSGSEKRNYFKKLRETAKAVKGKVYSSLDQSVQYAGELRDNVQNKINAVIVPPLEYVNKYQDDAKKKVDALLFGAKQGGFGDVSKSALLLPVSESSLDIFQGISNNAPSLYARIYKNLYPLGNKEDVRSEARAKEIRENKIISTLQKGLLEIKKLVAAPAGMNLGKNVFFSFKHKNGQNKDVNEVNKNQINYEFINPVEKALITYPVKYAAALVLDLIINAVRIPLSFFMLSGKGVRKILFNTDMKFKNDFNNIFTKPVYELLINPVINIYGYLQWAFVIAPNIPVEQPKKLGDIILENIKDLLKNIIRIPFAALAATIGFTLFMISPSNSFLNMDSYQMFLGGLEYTFEPLRKYLFAPILNIMPKNLVDALSKNFAELADFVANSPLGLGVSYVAQVVSKLVKDLAENIVLIPASLAIIPIRLLALASGATYEERNQTKQLANLFPTVPESLYLATVQPLRSLVLNPIDALVVTPLKRLIGVKPAITDKAQEALPASSDINKQKERTEKTSELKTDKSAKPVAFGFYILASKIKKIVDRKYADPVVNPEQSQEKNKHKKNHLS